MLAPCLFDFNLGPKLKSLLSQGIKIEYYKFIDTGGVSQSKETDAAPSWEIKKALTLKKFTYQELYSHK